MASTKKEKIQFVVIQNHHDGETIVCLPKDLNKIKRSFFAKDSGRNMKDDYIFYNVYENHVWLIMQAPEIESFYEERDE